MSAIRTIRAAVFHEAGKPFSIESLELAPPRAGEVLVQMKAAGVCHSDWHLMTGATKYPTPCVPGHEGAGVVAAVGPGVTRVKPGDHVAINWAPSCGECYYCVRNQPALCGAYSQWHWVGTMFDGSVRLRAPDGAPVYHFLTTACFAEYTVVPEPCAIRMPDDLPFTVSALIGCAVTTGAGAVLNKAKAAPGDSVAVFGAGGVGLSALLAAHLSGAAPIVAIDTNPEKLALARKCGATDTLLSSPDVNDQIRALTGGRGADVAIECVGIPALQEQALDAIRPGGMLVLAGISPMGSGTNLPGAVLTRKEKTVAGTYYGSGNQLKDFPLFAELYKSGRLDLDALIARTWALDEINEAYAEMLTGRSGRGVIVF